MKRHSHTRKEGSGVGLSLALWFVSFVCLGEEGPAARALRQIPLNHWLGLPAEKAEEAAVETAGSSYIPEIKDRETLRKVREAVQKEAAKEWLPALSVYQELSTCTRDELIPLTSNLYWPIRDYGLWRLARLAEDGRRLYVETYDPVSQVLWERARTTGDAAGMYPVAQQYLCTTYGPKAVAWLANWFFERGDFEASIAQWERLGRFLPERSFEDLWMPIQLAVCYRKLGRMRDFERAARLLKLNLGAQELVLGGERRSLKDFVQEIEEMEGPAQEAGDQPVFGGSNAHQHSLVGPARGEGWEGCLWSVSYLEGGIQAVRGPPIRERRGGEQVVQLGSGSDRGSPDELPLIFPSVRAGVVYYAAGGIVAARHLANGELLWTFPQSKGGRRSEMEAGLKGRMAASPTRSSWITVQGGRVWATVRSPWPGSPRDENVLVCLDAGEGTRIWDRGGSADPDGVISQGRIVGSPVVRGDRVYVCLVTEQGAYQSFLMCLDAGTGAMVWQTFICLARQSEREYYFRPGFDLSSLPAESGGMIYVSTSLGVVAAVRGDTGQMEWLARYERQPSRSVERSLGSEDAGTFAWQVNAPMVADGLVWVTPRDTEQLLCFDARTGRLRWKKHADENVYLLGYRKGKLYLSGPRVCCLDASDGTVVNRSVELEGAPAGLGLVGGNFVYCPGRDRLYQVFTDSGKLGHARSWPEGRGPGHLLQVGDILLVAGVSRLEAYAGEDYFQQQLERVRLNPGDISGRLTLGYLHFSRGDLESAAGHLQEVLELAAPELKVQGRAVHAEARQLLFRVYSRVAEEAEERGEDGPASAAFEKALEMAPDEELKFLGTINLAAHRERRGDSMGAVRLYQALITDFRGLRREEAGLDVASEVYAQERIEEVLKEAGRACYSEIEQEARGLFRQASQQDWRVRCEEVRARYPNSEAAQEALLVLGSTSLERGEAIEAYRYWSELDRLASEKASAVARAHLALCLARLGQPDEALKRCRELERSLSSRRFPFLGRETSFAEFQSRLRSEIGVPSEEEMTVPGVPARERWRARTHEMRILGLLDAFERKLQPGVAGRFFVMAGPGGVECWDAHTGQPRWLYPRRKREQGWLGIQITPDRLGFMRQVGRVIDQPAREAGLQPGDVIVRIGTSPIAPAPNARAEDDVLRQALANSIVDVIKRSPQGRDLPIVVERGGKNVVLQARLEGRPEEVWLAGITDSVAVIGANRTLFGLDVENGRPLWSRTLPDMQVPEDPDHLRGFDWEGRLTSLAESGPRSSFLGLMAIHFGGGRLRVLDTRKGTFLWEAESDGRLLEPSILAGEIVLSLARMGDSSGERGPVRLTARDLWTGRIQYELNLGLPSGNLTRSLAVSGPDTLCVLAEQALECRRLRTGALMGSTATKGQRGEILAAGDGLVAMISGRTILSVHDGKSGSLLWKRHSVEGAEWASVCRTESLYSRSRYVVAQASTGRIEGFEASTGRSVWQYDPEYPERETPYALQAAAGVILAAWRTGGGVDPGKDAPGPAATRLTLLKNATGDVFQVIDVPGSLQFTQWVGKALVVFTTEGVFGYEAEAVERGPQL
ncbi:MAG: PQQ-binding-like beta-propeller repeat protein [Planctomycetes bacterium]|nr:PQQ-binding-like beta-propeller repeat protein [Planctomycetota bacterium]